MYGLEHGPPGVVGGVVPADFGLAAHGTVGPVVRGGGGSVRAGAITRSGGRDGDHAGAIRGPGLHLSIGGYLGPGRPVGPERRHDLAGRGFPVCLASVPPGLAAVLQRDGEDGAGRGDLQLRTVRVVPGLRAVATMLPHGGVVESGDLEEAVRVGDRLQPAGNHGVAAVQVQALKQRRGVRRVVLDGPVYADEGPGAIGAGDLQRPVAGLCGDHEGDLVGIQGSQRAGRASRDHGPIRQLPGAAPVDGIRDYQAVARSGLLERHAVRAGHHFGPISQDRAQQDILGVVVVDPTVGARAGNAPAALMGEAGEDARVFVDLRGLAARRVIQRHQPRRVHRALQGVVRREGRLGAIIHLAQVATIRSRKEVAVHPLSGGVGDGSARRVILGGALGVHASGPRTVGPVERDHAIARLLARAIHEVVRHCAVGVHQVPRPIRLRRGQDPVCSPDGDGLALRVHGAGGTVHLGRGHRAVRKGRVHQSSRDIEGLDAPVHKGPAHQAALAVVAGQGQVRRQVPGGSDVLLHVEATGTQVAGKGRDDARAHAFLDHGLHGQQIVAHQAHPGTQAVRKMDLIGQARGVEHHAQAGAEIRLHQGAPCVEATNGARGRGHRVRAVRLRSGGTVRLGNLQAQEPGLGVPGHGTAVRERAGQAEGGRQDEGVEEDKPVRVGVGGKQFWQHLLGVDHEGRPVGLLLQGHAREGGRLQFQGVGAEGVEGVHVAQHHAHAAVRIAGDVEGLVEPIIEIDLPERGGLADPGALGKPPGNRTVHLPHFGQAVLGPSFHVPGQAVDLDDATLQGMGHRSVREESATFGPPGELPEGGVQVVQRPVVTVEVGVVHHLVGPQRGMEVPAPIVQGSGEAVVTLLGADLAVAGADEGPVLELVVPVGFRPVDAIGHLQVTQGVLEREVLRDVGLDAAHIGHGQATLVQGGRKSLPQGVGGRQGARHGKLHPGAARHGPGLDAVRLQGVGEAERGRLHDAERGVRGDRGPIRARHRDGETGSCPVDADMIPVAQGVGDGCAREGHLVSVHPGREALREGPRAGAVRLLAQGGPVHADAGARAVDSQGPRDAGVRGDGGAVALGVEPDLVPLGVREEMAPVRIRGDGDTIGVRRGNRPIRPHLGVRVPCLAVGGVEIHRGIRAHRPVPTQAASHAVELEGLSTGQGDLPGRHIIHSARGQCLREATGRGAAPVGEARQGEGAPRAFGGEGAVQVGRGGDGLFQGIHGDGSTQGVERRAQPVRPGDLQEIVGTRARGRRLHHQAVGEEVQRDAARQGDVQLVAITGVVTPDRQPRDGKGGGSTILRCGGLCLTGGEVDADHLGVHARAHRNRVHDGPVSIDLPGHLVVQLPETGSVRLVRLRLPAQVDAVLEQLPLRVVDGCGTIPQQRREGSVL